MTPAGISCESALLFCGFPQKQGFFYAKDFPYNQIHRLRHAAESEEKS